MGFNASLTPDDKIRFALGVGKPENIVEGVKAGYHIFDCVLLTRDALHKRVYVFKDRLESLDLESDFYKLASIYNLRFYTRLVDGVR